MLPCHARSDTRSEGGAQMTKLTVHCLACSPGRICDLRPPGAGTPLPSSQEEVGLGGGAGSSYSLIASRYSDWTMKMTLPSTQAVASGSVSNIDVVILNVHPPSKSSRRARRIDCLEMTSGWTVSPWRSSTLTQMCSDRAGAAQELVLLLMLKSRTLAYDNFVVCHPSQALAALEFLGNCPLYAEKWVRFTEEIAVMVSTLGLYSIPRTREPTMITEHDDRDPPRLLLPSASAYPHSANEEGASEHRVGHHGELARAVERRRGRMRGSAERHSEPSSFQVLQALPRRDAGVLARTVSLVYIRRTYEHDSRGGYDDEEGSTSEETVVKYAREISRSRSRLLYFCSGGPAGVEMRLGSPAIGGSREAPESFSILAVVNGSVSDGDHPRLF
ncbi:hypothetical protein NEOLEDRAFT_1193505 [Neolentinus lepideus HHB14362 ss-1]|uniref:Uncharacterized protein n=1 Tax=Neolentinus lepideus HHB14362 ss-1 TaxID=1314782 RepID=A0A165MHT8_9AGAM|nr:hypothetical protein NEOLEDRAFT_1193505 [Neolentinus lepideus HHB14362 ss-1]